MGPEGSPGAGVFHEKIFVRVVGEVEAMAFFAAPREAFHAKVVVGLDGQAALSGAGFEQALRQGDACRYSKLLHFGHCYGAEAPDVLLARVVVVDVVGREFDVLSGGDGAEVKLGGVGLYAHGVGADAAGDAGQAEGGLLVGDESDGRLYADAMQGRPVLEEEVP